LTNFRTSQSENPTWTVGWSEIAPITAVGLKTMPKHAHGGLAQHNIMLTTVCLLTRVCLLRLVKGAANLLEKRRV
jgi:hypothetical protein